MGYKGAMSSSRGQGLPASMGGRGRAARGGAIFSYKVETIVLAKAKLVIPAKEEVVVRHKERPILLVKVDHQTVARKIENASIILMM